jgi:hypothetical protein
MTTPNLVYVEWIDSGRGHEWRMLDDLDDMLPAYCRSVGWIVREEEEYIVLAGNLAADAPDGKPHQACQMMAIPKVAITTRRVLRKR